MSLTWLIAAVVWFLGFLALELVGSALAEAVLPLFTPLRLIYRPPHGRFMLAATWILAVAGTVVGSQRLESGFGVTVFIASIPLALLATASYRVESSEAAPYGYLPDRNRRP